MKPKRIPISAAKHIATEYNYDQVVILARRVDSSPEIHDGEEWITTYGKSKVHCVIASNIGKWVDSRLREWSDISIRGILESIANGKWDIAIKQIKLAEGVDEMLLEENRTDAEIMETAIAEITESRRERRNETK